MKIRILTLLLGVLGCAAGLAEKLPNGLDKPFLGCWLGFAGSRDFEFAIGGDGTSELFFKKGRVRHTTGGCTLHLHYVLEERIKNKGGKARWSSRQMQEDGFEDFGEETAQPEPGIPFSFTATYTGEVKVRITHVFTREGVEISTKVVGNKTGNEVRAGVRIVVGDMFRHIKEEELKGRELRSKVKESEIVVWPVDARKTAGEKIKFHDLDVNLSQVFPRGARKFVLESDRIADHEYQLSTADERCGRLEFRQKKVLLHGFNLYWWPDPAMVDNADCRLVIAVK